MTLHSAKVTRTSVKKLGTEVRRDVVIDEKILTVHIKSLGDYLGRSLGGASQGGYGRVFYIFYYGPKGYYIFWRVMK